METKLHFNKEIYNRFSGLFSLICTFKIFLTYFRLFIERNILFLIRPSLFLFLKAFPLRRNICCISIETMFLTSSLATDKRYLGVFNYKFSNLVENWDTKTEKLDSLTYTPALRNKY